MGTLITVRLDDKLEQVLDELCATTGKSRSEVIRDSLRRHAALAKFEALRAQIMPYAEAQGFLTDEDVFRVVS